MGARSNSRKCFRAAAEPASLRALSSAVRAAVPALEALEGRTLMSVTGTAVADADVQHAPADGRYANANFGKDKKLRVSAVAANALESFVTFDLRNVSTIANATLTFQGGRVDGGAEAVLVGAFPVADTGWVE